MGRINIFGRQPRIIFERRPATIPLEIDPRFLKLQETYARFCASSYMSEAQARTDFWAVCDLPGIAQIGFNPEGTELLIATEHVYLRGFIGPWRDIGEFIVRIRRNPTLLLFENMTPLNVPVTWNNGEVSIYHHPHINTSGAICMNQGKEELNLAISDGDMLTAVEIIWIALNTIGQHPHGQAELDAWPIAKGRT